MGLDLHCGNLSGAQGVRFGSYSYVQAVRRNWLKAYCKWAKETGVDSDFIDSLRKTFDDSRIYYEEFRKLDNKCPTFRGLRPLVAHSDCDGTWNPLDCEDILDTLETIRPQLKYFEPNNFDSEGQYYLEPILKESVETGEDVRFA